MTSSNDNRGLLQRHWHKGRWLCLAKAAALLGAALLANPWTLAAWVSGDGSLDPATRRYVLLADALLLTAAATAALAAKFWLPYSPRKERLLIGGSLSAATLPLMLLAGEAALRMTPRHGAAVQADRGFFCQFDADLGWVNRPLARCTFKGHPLSIDEFGMRDDRPAANAGAAPERVLLLGDSQVFGDGVAWPDTLGARLETLLPGVRTLNAGAIGYGPDQAVLAFERLAPRLKPTLAVVTLNAFDLRDVVRREIKGGYQKPMLTIGTSATAGEPELVLHKVSSPSVQQRLTRWLTQHSRLYVLATRRRARTPEQAARETAAWDSPDEVFPEDLAVALAVAEAILGRFHQTGESRGVKVAAVWLPYEMDYTQPEFRRRSDAAVSRLAAHAAAIGLPFCDLRPALETSRVTASDDSSALAPQNFFLDKLHFSSAGHERMATHLAAWLKAERLVEPEAESATLTQTATP